jgi:hypothetical protein
VAGKRQPWTTPGAWEPGQCTECGRVPKRGDVVYRRYDYDALLGDQGEHHGREMKTFCAECASKWHDEWLSGEPVPCKGDCGLLVSTPYERWDPATEQNVPQTEYCSLRCRRRAIRHRYREKTRVPQDLSERVCPIDGRSFMPRIGNQVYCSPKCRNRARYLNRWQARA